MMQRCVAAALALAWLVVPGAGQQDKGKSPEETKVEQAKLSTYYGKWKTGELLAKYCERPAWRYEKAKDLVEFRGKLKKDGAELVAHFKVFYGWLDKSNTEKGWVVVDEGATLGGRDLPLWKSKIFVDEFKQMGGNRKEK